jgi:hypothetical protein
MINHSSIRQERSGKEAREAFDRPFALAYQGRALALPGWQQKFDI